MKEQKLGDLLDAKIETNTIKNYAYKSVQIIFLWNNYPEIPLYMKKCANTQLCAL